MLRNEDSYTLEQAAELAGLHPDRMWDLCERAGISTDAVPAWFVTRCRYLLGVLLDTWVPLRTDAPTMCACAR